MRGYNVLAMDPDEGYSEARKILKKRYGESYRIATAYVDRVTKGPALKAKDSKGLQKLSYGSGRYRKLRIIYRQSKKLHEVDFHLREDEEKWSKSPLFPR